MASEPDRARFLMFVQWSRSELPWYAMVSWMQVMNTSAGVQCIFSWVSPSTLAIQQLHSLDAVSCVASLTCVYSGEWHCAAFCRVVLLRAANMCLRVSKFVGMNRPCGEPGFEGHKKMSITRQHLLLLPLQGKLNTTSSSMGWFVLTGNWWNNYMKSAWGKNPNAIQIARPKNTGQRKHIFVGHNSWLMLSWSDTGICTSPITTYLCKLHELPGTIMGQVLNLNFAVLFDDMHHWSFYEWMYYHV